MSITPKLIDIKGNRKLNLHMRVENPLDFELNGSINFIINYKSKRIENISKKVNIPRKSNKDFFLIYKIKPSFKKGFYKVLAFFECGGKRVYSQNKNNDYFWVADKD